MKLFDKFALPWGSDLPALQAETVNNPQIICSEIVELEKTLTQGNPEDKATAASAIRTAIAENPSVGLDSDVFEVILRTCDDDLPSVRQPLVKSLGKVAPIVDGDMRRQMVASSHVLTSLLEHDDDQTIKWALPAVSEAIQEYPDPFIDHADAIAVGLDSDEELVATSAIEALAAVAEQDHAPVKPYVSPLIDLHALQDDPTPYQYGEAMRAATLVVANDHTIVAKNSYTKKLKSMHRDVEPVPEQFAIRSMGYLLSAEPEVWEDYDFLDHIVQSLHHHDDHIKKDAAIACLRIIRNTETDLLDDPNIARALHYCIEQYDLERQLLSIDEIADKIKANMVVEEEDLVEEEPPQ